MSNTKTPEKAVKKELKINGKGIYSALEAQNLAPNNVKTKNIKIYTEWKDKNFTRGRVTYYTNDEKIVSYFIHLGIQELKIWLPNSKNGPPDMILTGNFY